ncbi:hypothetical protein [Leifsonia shinshuensis]|uniref:Uncharacterized protein n=1 Tax=Leifsonia shinshuensis TaxID=150026 RepID=A0A7G6YD23_9MICO|nr:hypothetical protein [Leifsonia shinshuensis]QNE36388.1 hypothetical protein F1C12_15555 [Leifsonia shinshuensis]
MTQGDEPRPDAADDRPPLTVPPGVPLRVWDWLLLPVLLVAGVSLVVWLYPASWLKGYFAFAGVLVLAAAVVQAVNGYRVYVGWSETDILRYRRSVTSTIAAVAVFCLFGTYGVFAFVALGYRLAADPAESLRRARAALSGRMWIRLTVAAGIVTAVVTVARPLASAMGGLIGVLGLALAVLAPIIAGFAYRSRPEGHRFF